MGPRIREDNGRGRAVPEPPLRGSHRTRRRRATTRVAPTKTGMGVGGVGGWIPAPVFMEAGSGREKRIGRAFTRGVPTKVGSDGERREGRFETCPCGEGVECRRRGKDGFPPPSSRGQALRGKTEAGDGSPHPRGQREGEGGSRTAPTWELPNTT